MTDLIKQSTKLMQQNKKYRDNDLNEGDTEARRIRVEGITKIYNTLKGKFKHVPVINDRYYIRVGTDRSSRDLPNIAVTGNMNGLSVSMSSSDISAKSAVQLSNMMLEINKNWKLLETAFKDQAKLK